MNKLGVVQAQYAKALFATDPERAWTLFEQAAPLILDGLRGMSTDPPHALGNPTKKWIEQRKDSRERAIRAFTFWDRARPGRGFGERARDLGTELKHLEGS